MNWFSKNDGDKRDTSGIAQLAMALFQAADACTSQCAYFIQEQCVSNHGLAGVSLYEQATPEERLESAERSNKVFFTFILFFCTKLTV